MSNLSASENLKLFDEMRAEAITATNDAIKCAKTLANDEDFSDYGKNHLDKLEYSKHILQDNTLPLSLMASFQNGKSTTTSAMADGHEITPCGKGGGGIRTSSIPVTIYNNEYSTEVVVNPYSTKTLVQCIIDSCGPQLNDPNPLSYNLDNGVDKDKLITAVKNEIEVYRSSNNYANDKLDILHNAILILSFYGSESYKKLIHGEFKTITDIQPFIAFPNDLEVRWAKLKDYGFDITNQKDEKGNLLFDELSSLYVFVDNIVVPVHSEFMGQTGTAIIDAPGTMASNEDTERALAAAASAAVVLFLLSGSTQFSTEDKKMLSTLKNAGMAEKVVFVMNFRKNPDWIRSNIEKTLLAQIEQSGYTKEHHKKILYYNAFLAQRAAQGQLLLDNKMDSLTADSIISDAIARFQKKDPETGVPVPPILKFSVEEAWKKTTLKVLRAIDADDTADELSDLGLCQKTVDLISNESQWKEMITSLREHVMNNRVAGVLKDLGVQPVHDSLRAIEDALEAREKLAIETEKTIKEEYLEAKKLLEKFSDEVENVVSVELNESVDKILANSYYDEVVIGSIEEAAQLAAPEIFKATGVMGNVKDIGDKVLRFGEKAANAIAELATGKRPVIEHEPNGLKEKCSDIVSKYYKRTMLEKGHAWSNDLETSPEYVDNVKNKVRHIQKSLLKTWDDLGLGQNDLLSNVPFPDKLSGLISKDAANVNVRDIIVNTAVSVQMGIAALFKGVGAGFGAFVGGVWVYYFVLPLDFVIPGFAELLLLASSVIAAVVYALSTKKKDKQIEKITTEIESNLSKTVSTQKKKIIKNIIKGDMDATPPAPGISYVRTFYVTLFNGIVEQQKNSLEHTYQEKLKELKKSEAEREKIAKKAAVWHKDRVEPIRQKLTDMLEKINSIWG